MTDPNISNTPAPLSTPAVPATDPVQDLVDQALDVQQTFQNNDTDSTDTTIGVDVTQQAAQPQTTSPIEPPTDSPDSTDSSMNGNTLRDASQVQTTASAEQSTDSTATVEPTSTQSPLDDLLANAQAAALTPAVATDQPATEDTAGKSPLDILEEILGKSESGEGAVPEEPKVPEKSPEEIEAERVAREAAEKIQLEQQREVLLKEISSPAQQEREVIRDEQTKLLESDDHHDIYQIKREKVAVSE